MKITTKTTKEQLKEFLGANAKLVKEKDKDLFDRIVYASNMCKKDDSKVKKSDLASIAKDVIDLLGEECKEPATKQETPVVENSVKKLNKGKKQEQPKEEESSEESGKKTIKKSSKSKKEQETPVVEPMESSNEKDIQMAKLFPKELEVEGTKYELADDIKTMEDLHKALNNDVEIVFAYYWTKRHLRQFPYFNDWLGHPKSFDKDLDLTTTFYVSEEYKVAYNVSLFTEAVYTILPNELEEEDGIRFSGGIEYQIYRAV